MRVGQLGGRWQAGSVCSSSDPEVSRLTTYERKRER